MPEPRRCTGPTVIGTRGPMRCASAPARAENSSIIDGDRQQRGAGVERASSPRSVWRCTTSRNVVAPSARVHGERHHVGARELPRPEHRRAAPSGATTRSSMTTNATSASDARRHRSRSSTPASRSPGPSISAYDDAAEAERQRSPPRAKSIERSARSRRALSGTWRMRHDDRRGDERQVDEEHQAPRHRVDQPAAEERPDRGRHAAEPRPRADRAASVVGWNDAEMIARLPGTSSAAATPCTQRAAISIARRRRDPAAAATPTPNPSQADHEHACAARTGRRASRRARATTRASAGSPVSTHCRSARSGVEVAADRGERGVDDGAVEERDARAEHRGGDDPPPGPRAHSDRPRRGSPSDVAGARRAVRHGCDGLGTDPGISKNRSST